MPSHESFESMLTGGHPNSLGRTVEVVDLITQEPALLEDLYQCYFSKDEIVRLRVSSAMKRLWRAHPAWLVPYADRFLAEIAQIDQDSTRWTLAQYFLELDTHLSPEQRERAKAMLKLNFEQTNDWIVLINTMETLETWAKADDELRKWLQPHVQRLQSDKRKTVAKKANEVAKSLYGA